MSGFLVAGIIDQLANLPTCSPNIPYVYWFLTRHCQSTLCLRPGKPTEDRPKPWDSVPCGEARKESSFLVSALTLWGVNQRVENISVSALYKSALPLKIFFFKVTFWARQRGLVA